MLAAYGGPGMDVGSVRPFVDDFIDLYRSRPILRNAGGMGLNHCFGLYALLRLTNPGVVIESGVWRGQSTWLIEMAAPGARIVCLDPRPDLREYTSARATYLTDDFAMVDWSEVDAEDSLCFFDDHQNAYSRLMEMRWWGFRRAIFEDNFPPGQGDSYSLRHAFAEFGHPRIQMSEAYAPRGRRARRERGLEERVLMKYHDRQQMLRRPNAVDATALRRNLEIYWETPALVLNPHTNWGGDWSGPYATATDPLFSRRDESPALATFLAELDEVDARQELQYGYMAYVRLRGGTPDLRS